MQPCKPKDELIEIHLENYQYVEAIQTTDSDVVVSLDSSCKFYDSDAIIGRLVRVFDLDYVEETEDDGIAMLHFSK